MNFSLPSQWIRPVWDVPGRVGALATTRHGGISQGAFESCNLGFSSGDDPQAVNVNRQRLEHGLPARVCWLNQIHGTDIVHLDDWRPGVRADAAWTDRPGQAAAILTADCLPILLAGNDGGLVAAMHAGWRGLAAGIIAQVLAALPAPPERLRAWIGPGISQARYEVDEAVRSAFISRSAHYQSAFSANARGRFQADLKWIASTELRSAGVTRVVDSGLCTAGDPGRFYSHRRDQGLTGRQATLVWLVDV